MDLWEMFFRENQWPVEKERREESLDDLMGGKYDQSGTGDKERPLGDLKNC